MEDKNQVAVIIQRLYQNLPGAQSPRSPWSYQVFQAGNVLSVEQQLHMCFPNEEIRKAIFSIPKDKSPGNYGFFGSFFKAAWQDIGLWHAMLFKNLLQWIAPVPDEYCESQELFLIPKVLQPTLASDFRPIACCNVVCKCLRELMCQRLTEVLPSLVCQELGRGYYRKAATCRCMIKIDMKKHMTP